MASDASDPMMEEIRKKSAGKTAKHKDVTSDEEAKPKKKKAKKEE